MTTIVGISGSLRRRSRLMVSHARDVFDPGGALVDAAIDAQLRAFLAGFAGFVSG